MMLNIDSEGWILLCSHNREVIFCNFFLFSGLMHNADTTCEVQTECETNLGFRQC